MGDVKVQVRISHLAVGAIANGIENKTVYSKGQEFTCSEEEAKRLGTSVIIIEKIPDIVYEKASAPDKTGKR